MTNVPTPLEFLFIYLLTFIIIYLFVREKYYNNVSEVDC